jgi:DNA-binding ferritin-like protein
VPLGDVPPSGVSGKTSEPIGSSAEQELSSGNREALSQAEALWESKSQIAGLACQDIRYKGPVYQTVRQNNNNKSTHKFIPTRSHALVRQALQERDERQFSHGGPASTKKRRTDLESEISIEQDDLLRIIENAAARASQCFIVPAATGGSVDDIRSLRDEMMENIAEVQTRLTEAIGSALMLIQSESDKRTDMMFERLVQQVQTHRDNGEATQTTSEETVQMLRNEMEEGIARAQTQLTELLNNALARMQTESDRRADTMLERLVQKLHGVSEQVSQNIVPAVRAHAIPGLRTDQQSYSQPTQVAQRTWADVTRTATQAAAGWTTMTNGKRKLKKHALDQRRILFTRNSQSQQCDSRYIMFEINKALAHARAEVTVRIIKMKYTEKGNLSCVLSEHACAEELLRYAPAVMAAVQKLDPTVTNVEKTERWRKLRVHGVALDRYMTENGLDLLREEIEVMTGSQLP